MHPVVKYLGMLLFVKRSMKKYLEEIKSKVLSRVAGWKAKTLSQATRKRKLSNNDDFTQWLLLFLLLTRILFFFPKLDVLKLIL